MHKHWKRGLVGLAIAATVAAGLLALYPGLAAPGEARYDPGLAVLTATLVVVIWTAVATAIAATRVEPTAFAVGLEKTGYVLKPRVNNLSRRMVQEVTVTMRVWLDDKEVVQSAFYRGADPFAIGPTGSFHGHVDLLTDFDFVSDSHGLPIPEQNEIKVLLQVNWKDDLGETGTLGPRFYHTFRTSDEVASVVAEKNKNRLFPPKVLESDVSTTSKATPVKHGFEHSESGETHALRRRFRILRRHMVRAGSAESMDGSTRKVVHVGKYVVVEIDPIDLRDPLVHWLTGGENVPVVYLPDVDAPQSGVPCGLLLDDIEVMDRPDWTWGDPVRVRITPSGNWRELLAGLRIAVGADE